jgi:hypothetical protein
MAKPSRFGEQLDAVERFVKKLSEEHQRKRVDLTLRTVVQEVVSKFGDFSDGKNDKQKRMAEYSLKFVLYRMMLKEKIWFGRAKQLTKA